MIEIPSTKDNLSNLFRYWVNLYDNKQFPDFEAVYQFVFLLKRKEKSTTSIFQVFGKKFTDEEMPGVEDKIQDFEILKKRV